MRPGLLSWPKLKRKLLFMNHGCHSACSYWEIDGFNSEHYSDLMHPCLANSLLCNYLLWVCHLAYSLWTINLNHFATLSSTACFHYLIYFFHLFLLFLTFIACLSNQVCCSKSFYHFSIWGFEILYFYFQALFSKEDSFGLNLFYDFVGYS